MLTAFTRDEEGAQVVEYALIIAVISVALILAFEPLTVGAGITSVIQRLTDCLTSGPCA